MTVTAASFRVDFPEFANTTNFPEATIDFWIAVAGKLLRADVWGNMLDPATELFVAHNIVLARQAALAAAGGGLPGSGSGVIASKSVDKVSISYDTGSATLMGAGHWNLTNYGTRFQELVQIFGAGPFTYTGVSEDLLSP